MDTKITPKEIIFLIPTCKNYSDKTDAVRNTWTKQLAIYEFRYLFLMGKPDIKQAEIIDDILYVPCKDDYESLLLKLVLGYEFLYKNMDFKYVYKIDDDCYPDLKKLVEEIVPQLDNRQYLGGATHPNGANMNNEWHFGKCSDPKFDKPYKFNIAPFEFAKGGYGYFLHKDVLPHLFALKNELSSELEKYIYSYEDVRIAEILNKNGILVNSLENYSIISASNYNNSNQYLVYDIQNPGLMKLIERQRLETKKLLPIDSSLNHYFDHIYVINLEFKVADRLTTSEHLKKHGVDFEIFKATNGYKGEPLEIYKEYQKRELGDLKRYPEYNEWEKKLGHHFLESAGAVGIIYSFIRILRDAKKRGYKRFLILEDDILLSKDFESEFKSFVENIDDDWKILLLGASQYGWKNIDIDTAAEKGFYFPKKCANGMCTYGAFAIAFNSAVIDGLIEEASAFESPFDNFPLSELYERYLGKCFVAYPNIMMPDVAESGIRGKRDQYSHSKRVKWKLENFDYPLKKPSISIIITDKENLKYYSNFSKTKQLPFDLRLFLNSHDGLRPLHNTDLLDAKENKILPFNKQFFVPSSDYLVTIEEDENLTEDDIIKFIEYKQNIQKNHRTPLKEIGTDRRKIKKDRVSVIIPISKQPKDLKPALESVISQNYPSIEVIVVSDNGKNSKFADEIRQIVSSFNGRNVNCNVVLLEHSAQRNESSARNTGIMNSTGEYICFLNDNDIYLPFRLSMSIEVLKTTNKAVGAVYCGYLGLDSQKNNLNRYKTGDLTLELLLFDDQKHYLHSNTITYKREALLNLNGFDESYHEYQELEFNLRFFEQYTVEAVKEALVQVKSKNTDHTTDEVTIVESKQKFLNQFSYIIEKYDHDLEKSIYEAQWTEVKRFISDINIFIDKTDKKYKEGLLNMLKVEYDKKLATLQEKSNANLVSADKKLARIQKKYDKVNSKNISIENKLKTTLNSTSYKLGHMLIHKKKALLNPKTLVKKIKTVIKMISKKQGNKPGMNNKNNNHNLSITIPEKLENMYTKGIIKSSKPVIYKELVSIIIPSYNNTKWISKAINSALSQQGVNIELIVVDDGSTDDSIKVIEEIAKKNNNIKLISLLKNFGCYYARNIGVLHANGEYITIIDSDDIMSQDRILLQLNVLNKTTNAVATRCQQRRWKADYSSPISELKPGENSLLWKKEILSTIGYYDTVKYSGDAEFRLRIQRTFGLEAVITTSDELYFTRTLENSLTTLPDSMVFEIEKDALKVNVSPQRKLYEDNFTSWQERNMTKELAKKGGMFINFPQFERSFKLGAESQNASPSLNQKCIGKIASFPPRENSLKAAVATILDQVDELHVYLNDYEYVPTFLEQNKIHVTRSQEAVGDLRDNGKFYNMPSDDESYIFTFDDDLLYPDDYIAKMIHYIEMLGRQCIVGVHGVIFPDTKLTHLDQRKVFNFQTEQKGYFVDLLGTGTTAWHSSILNISLSDFKSKGICDVYFAAVARKQNISMFSVPRTKEWLKEPKKHDISLYKEALSNIDNFLNIYQKFLEPEIIASNTRRKMEYHLTSGYDLSVLSAAGIELYETEKEEPIKDNFNELVSSEDIKSDNANNLKFHIIVNGWNCSKYVDKCIRSIAEQHIGLYTYDVTLIDDASNDDTFDKLYKTLLFPSATITKLKQNMGPAYARHVGISTVSNPNAIVVLVDMDDALEPNALKVVAERYLANQNCLITIGNWIDQNDKINPQKFYTDDEINKQDIRKIELFNATHLRTFKRKLYNAIEENDLKDKEGHWFTVCTDVALMYPLMDQCWANEIEFIKDPIYRYTRSHGSGTLAKFGKPYKLKKLADLKDRSPKVKMHYP